MKISTNWLAQYIQHGLTTSDLADRLTMCGLEVESVEEIGSALEGVVVGHVTRVLPHPDADRLTVCQVDVGADEELSIVCGAPNVAAGQRVPVAMVGTELLLPSKEGELTRITLKRTRIRGQVSQGMICAEDELGLSDDHSGIMVLDQDAPVGTPLAQWLASRGIAVRDAVIDISITPNRPDAISHYGVARDLSALTGRPAMLPEVDLPSNGGRTAKQVSISLEAGSACGRYVGILVSDVTVAESPAWLKQRLSAVGLRPRNNIVDITNFVMMECGQPLHAFDFDQVAGGRIVVRETSTPQSFTTLDNKERTLPAGSLMIADGERDVAIAGIMGGQNSEVTDQTRTVLIESAWFEPSGVRRTAGALGLQTDASYRFERGVDPTLQAWAAARAAGLMVELAGGKTDGIVDVDRLDHAPREIELRAARVEGLMGMAVFPARIEALLSAIGFTLDRTGESGGLPVWKVQVPPFKFDVDREVDVIEEVARLNGFETIPLPTHSRIPNFTPVVKADRALREHARDLLAGAGYREIITNSMLSKDVAEAFHAAELPAGTVGGNVVETLNPITTEMAVLRPSLLPGMLRVAAHNQNHGQRSLRFFEFGRIHMRATTDLSVVADYTELESLLIGVSGEARPASWSGDGRDLDFFDVKGILGRLFRAMRLTDVRYESASHLDVSQHGLTIISGDDRIGFVGQTDRRQEEAFGCRTPLLFAELDWMAVGRRVGQLATPRFREISRFPIVDRDLAVVVSARQAIGPLLSTVLEAGGKLIKEANVFDVYQGDNLGSGLKSVAFGLRFAASRTLRDKEVDQAVAVILERLESEFGAKLR